MKNKEDEIISKQIKDTEEKKKKEEEEKKRRLDELKVYRINIRDKLKKIENSNLIGRKISRFKLRKRKRNSLIFGKTR
jgi:hypothetical protein